MTGRALFVVLLRVTTCVFLLLFLVPVVSAVPFLLLHGEDHWPEFATVFTAWVLSAVFLVFGAGWIADRFPWPEEAGASSASLPIAEWWCVGRHAVGCLAIVLAVTPVAELLGELARGAYDTSEFFRFRGYLLVEIAAYAVAAFMLLRRRTPPGVQPS